MPRILLAQTLGSALVPSCFALSHAASRLLYACPTSTTAWYLNLAVFAPLQQVRTIPSILTNTLDHSTVTEFFFVAVLMGAVHAARFRLGVAVFTHLAFGSSLLIAQAWIMNINGAIVPGLLLVREVSGTILVVFLAITTGLACALSHLFFILAILRSKKGDSVKIPRSLWYRTKRVLADRAPAAVLSSAT